MRGEPVLACLPRVLGAWLRVILALCLAYLLRFLTSAGSWAQGTVLHMGAPVLLFTCLTMLTTHAYFMHPAAAGAGAQRGAAQARHRSRRRVVCGLLQRRTAAGGGCLQGVLLHRGTAAGRQGTGMALPCKASDVRGSASATPLCTVAACSLKPLPSHRHTTRWLRAMRATRGRWATLRRTRSRSCCSGGWVMLHWPLAVFLWASWPVWA